VEISIDKNYLDFEKFKVALFEVSNYSFKNAFVNNSDPQLFFITFLQENILVLQDLTKKKGDFN